MPFQDRRKPDSCLQSPGDPADLRTAVLALHTPPAWWRRWEDRPCRSQSAGLLDSAENFRLTRAGPFARCGREQAALEAPSHRFFGMTLEFNPFADAHPYDPLSI